ncbi:MAG: hypothetical protein J6K38_06460 [Alistipes sp.]|nr:hypothetical protein [Alistipes sp.]
MIRRVYHIMILCCALCWAATDAAAQVCWESLDVSRQRKTLASRSLHASVRQLCQTECECDTQTADEAVAQMTAKCKDRYRAALYIDLYDRLHELRRVDAATDAMIMQLHAEALLTRLEYDNDIGRICRWGYTLAKHYLRAGGAEAFDEDLRKALGRCAKKHSQSHRQLSECVHTAIGSLEAAGKAIPDATEPRRAATGFVDITRQEYAAERATARRLTMPAETQRPQSGIYGELLWRDGVCCRKIDISRPDVEAVACNTHSGDCIVLTGSDGVGVTLPVPVEMAPEGMLYALGHEAIVAAVISAEATVEMIGAAALPEGELLQMKCCDESVSVEVATANGKRYYQWRPSM